MRSFFWTPLPPPSSRVAAKPRIEGRRAATTVPPETDRLLTPSVSVGRATASGPSFDTPLRGRVGGWRARFRVRWLFRCFRSGPQSGSLGRVSSPPLPEPGVPISGTGLSSGIMRLAHGPPGQGRGRAGDPALRGRCTTAILPPASSPMRRRACSRLDDIEPVGFDSFASACDALRALRPKRGVLGKATPAGVRPSRIPPHLRPLPSAGITRHPRYYGPLRHPAGPACPSRGPGWRVHATDGASRVAALPLFHACRRHYPGGTARCPFRSLPGRCQPSPK